MAWSYKQLMNSAVPRRTALAVMLVSSLALTPRVLGSAQARVGAAPVNYSVNIGVDFFYHGFVINKFFPDHITIHVGDSVTWLNLTPDRPQTVTFGPPENTPALIVRSDVAEINPRIVKPQGGLAVGGGNASIYSSGALIRGIPGLPTQVTFTFPKAGTYLYRSLFHPLTQGEIDVVSKDMSASPQPLDYGPSLYDALRSVAQVTDGVRAVARAAGATNAGVAEADIQIGAGDGNISVTNLLPEGTRVKAGSTVVWNITETSGDPHILIFNNPTEQERGGIKLYTGLAPDGGLIINPIYRKATLASGASVTTNTIKLAPGGRWTSGILYGSSVNYPSSVPSTYKLTFMAPVRIDYVDAVPPGDQGTIVVNP